MAFNSDLAPFGLASSLTNLVTFVLELSRERLLLKYFKDFTVFRAANRFDLEREHVTVVGQLCGGVNAMSEAHCDLLLESSYHLIHCILIVP